MQPLPVGASGVVDALVEVGSRSRYVDEGGLAVMHGSRCARRLGSELEVQYSRRSRDGMRSALGPCSNDDRVSLCLFGCSSQCRGQDKDTAGTHVLSVPASCLCSSCRGSLLLALLLCSYCCCYRAPPLSSPIVHRLGYLQYGHGYAVSLSPSTHLLACFACIRLPISHPPSRHGASFSFLLSVQPKHTPPQHLAVLTHSLPPTYPVALSESNLKVHSTVALISARLSACRASSIPIVVFLPPPATTTARPPTMSSRKKVLLKV